MSHDADNRVYSADVYHPKHIVGEAVNKALMAGKVRSFDELVNEVCKVVPYGRGYVLHVIGKWRDKIEADIKK
jgi:hypothetical protein